MEGHFVSIKWIYIYNGYAFFLSLLLQMSQLRIVCGGLSVLVVPSAHQWT